MQFNMFECKVDRLSGPSWGRRPVSVRVRVEPRQDGINIHDFRAFLTRISGLVSGAHRRPIWLASEPDRADTQRRPHVGVLGAAKGNEFGRWNQFGRRRSLFLICCCNVGEARKVQTDSKAICLSSFSARSTTGGDEHQLWWWWSLSSSSSPPRPPNSANNSKLERFDLVDG